ncbi:hypothetical protein ACG2LH_03885 [Zhouia sp. PK063]|uniref:hypothetical protein n=1 Tax=Zhouia sp. PK063 TaxID=3373602 RepID=UPI00379AD5D0
MMMKPYMRPRKKFFFLFPIVILFAVTGIVMWLWNMILPDVLDVKTITYWQAMGILVLSKILFGGFHGCKKGPQHKHKRAFFRKMKSMTPEERDEFKERWKQQFKNQDHCKK